LLYSDKVFFLVEVSHTPGFLNKKFEVFEDLRCFSAHILHELPRAKALEMTIDCKTDNLYAPHFV